MAGAVVQQTQGSSGAPANGLHTGSNLGVSVTTGHLLFGAGVYQHSSQLATSFTDSQANSYVQLIDWYDATSDYGIALFAAYNVAAGTTAGTFKCGTGEFGTTPSGAKIGSGLVQFSGLHASAPFTVGETASNVQAAPGTGTDAITTGNFPVLAVQPGLQVGLSMDLTSTATSSSGTGFTFIQNMWSFGVATRACLTFRRLTATTAVPMTWTNSAGGGGNRHGSLGAFLNETGAVVAGVRKSGGMAGGMRYLRGGMR